MVDEDSHSSAGTVPGPGTSLPSSSGPGLTSPPYTATPVDHDYVKCKKTRQQATPDGTVPVLNTAGTAEGAVITAGAEGGRDAAQLGADQFFSLLASRRAEGFAVTRAILRLINAVAAATSCSA